jgi:hypothetical protein
MQYRSKTIGCCFECAAFNRKDIAIWLLGIKTQLKIAQTARSTKKNQNSQTQKYRQSVTIKQICQVKIASFVNAHLSGEKNGNVAGTRSDTALSAAGGNVLAARLKRLEFCPFYR